MSSGFSASVSGIKAAFLKQSVNSDNVSNLNTSGFKESDVHQVADAVAGTRVSEIKINNNQGPLLQTDRPTDLAIEGNGFFIVEKDGQQRFTRSGSLGIDGEGQLVNNATGGIVQGIDGGDTEPIRIESDRSGPIETDTLSFSGNLSSEMDIGDTEKLSVDLTNSQGVSQTAVLEFEKSGINQFKVTAQDDQSGKTALEADLSFDSSGNLESLDVQDSPNNSETFQGLFLQGEGESGPIEIEANNLNFENVTQQAGESTVRLSEVGGKNAGQFSSFSVNSSGEVIGQFTNGERKQLGQIATANFSNPDGLDSSGNGLLLSSANSGQPQIGIPGTGNRGKLRSGVLEASNVDMVRQFTDMLSERSSLQANVDAVKVRQEMLGSVLDIKQ